MTPALLLPLGFRRALTFFSGVSLVSLPLSLREGLLALAFLPFIFGLQPVKLTQEVNFKIEGRKRQIVGWLARQE